MSEGVSDSFVPLWSTETAAAALGIPLVAPAPLAAPFLATADGDVAGNIHSTTTAALAQYIPVGVPGLPPTPGCLANGQSEGHFCAQSAAEAFVQRRVFLVSALTNAAPTIRGHDTIEAAPAPAPVPAFDIVGVAADRTRAPRPDR